ncbi:MAG: PBP1A family penicillin-binding protein [Salaquimonas sp.]|nr:PBP1A family penicillin-binding protein [Salaquimonas sp.]
MRDPFGKSGRGKTRNVLLGIDSWIDSTLFNLFSDAGDRWEAITIFFRRFRVTGFKKLAVEVVDESITLGLAGLVVLAALAMPAFEETNKDWRASTDYAVTMLDRYGHEIGRRGIHQSDSKEIDALPDNFVKAVLATEDRRFFNHWGIDLFGLARAMVENVKANEVVQGGSTITQQLAKNLFLSNERTLNRKIKEAFLSLWLEANLSKKEILKLYLDRAYMGGGNFGVTAAAQYYFGKSVKDLTLAEAAMLAGLYKAPTRYAPHINLPAARARANEVLTNMVEAGFLTEGQVIAARRNPASIVERNDEEGPNYFMDAAFEEVKKLAVRFPTRTFIAKTTVDLDLQKAADEAIESNLRQYGKQYHAGEAAMVVIDRDGAVRAIVGGRDYGASQFNRATTSRRQPGSSFKPIVYASSIENFGYDDHTPVTDAPICIGKWCPHNYSGGYHGHMDFTTALIHSYNSVPPRLYVGGYDHLKGLGGKRIEETARKMGITSPLVLNPPMVLGANGLTPYEMATAFGTFMTGGTKLDSHMISQITDGEGNVLYDYKRDHAPPQQALSERTVAAMNRMLVQVPERGTGRRAALDGIRAAGKTGTTSAYRDAWFCGFTGNFVAAVWFGNDDYTTMNRMTGGSVPAMTWKTFMTYAHQNIDLLPIPYIDNPLPDATIANAGSPARRSKDADQTVARRKNLSGQAEEMLRQLERKLRDAAPVSSNQVVASQNAEAGDLLTSR